MGGFNTEIIKCCSCNHSKPPSRPIKKTGDNSESEYKDVFHGHPWQPMRPSMRPIRRRREDCRKIQQATTYTSDYTSYNRRHPVDIADLVAPPERIPADNKSMYKTAFPRYNKKKMAECNPAPVIPLGSITVPPPCYTNIGKKSITKTDYVGHPDGERRWEIRPESTVNVYGSSLNRPRAVTFTSTPLYLQPSPECGEVCSDMPEPHAQVLSVEDERRAPSVDSAGDLGTPKQRGSPAPQEHIVPAPQEYSSPAPQEYSSPAPQEYSSPAQSQHAVLAEELSMKLASVPVRQEPKEPVGQSGKWQRSGPPRQEYKTNTAPSGKDFYKSLTCPWPKNAWNDELFKVINGGDTESERPKSTVLSTTMADFQNPRDPKRTKPFVPTHNHEFGLPTKPEDYQTTMERTYRPWQEPKPQMPPWGQKAKFTQPTIDLSSNTTYKQYYTDPKAKGAPKSIPVRYQSRIPYVEAAVGKPQEAQTSYRQFYQPWTEYERPVNCMEKRKFKPPATPMAIVSVTQEDFRGEPMPRRAPLKNMPQFQGLNIDPSLCRTTLYGDEFNDPRVKAEVEIPANTKIQAPGPQGKLPEAEAKLVLPKDDTSASEKDC